ncbi:hypothetical protein [Calidithermus timidus]|uniref:hypothetical protein n=1 Tax=Calidithermus timidus TaxID=307124 RepID=UPI00035C3C02|nr:hypothetical protein [Calidithermus timidus]
MSLPPGIPPLYATEQEPDPVVWACYLHPRTRWAWFVLEHDGEQTFFGLVHGFADELGYFDRLELESAGAYLDPAWQPRPLSEVRAILAKECGYREITRHLAAGG